MVHVFGILLRISMDPRRMGGYLSYFQYDPVLDLGQGYHAVHCSYASCPKKRQETRPIPCRFVAI
eukprot:15331569-Ditylum_brightwellii.AAC.2